MAAQSSEAIAWRRSVVAGLVALAVGLGGELALGEPAQASGSGSAPFIERALAQVTPQLPLADVGRWLGRAVLGASRADSCRRPG